MWGHALGKDVSPLRKSRVGQEDAASGGSHGKGQERIRAAAILVRGGCLHELQQVSGCCSVRREEGCGHSRITLPGSGRWHNQHSAASGEQRPVLALRVTCPPPPSLVSSLGSMQTNSRVVCSANTVAGNTNTQPARAGLCWNPLAPGQDSAPGVGMGPGTTAAEVTFRRSVGGHAPVPGLLVPASQRMGWGGTHPHQPHYPKLQPNLTCAHPLPHS